MRHAGKVNKLSRTHSHRMHMIANMATSLILHKKITTTVAKAKELRKYVEPIINRAKDDSTHSRRIVFSFLQSKEAVSELFREISTKIANRPGGYTRILKTGTRLGDNAEMCIIELVDYNDNLLKAKEEKASKSSRRKRSKKKSDDTTTQKADSKVVDDKKDKINLSEDKPEEVTSQTENQTVETSIKEEEAGEDVSKQEETNEEAKKD